ncbi:MAG: hypothetical protein Q9160_003010 [Pyrenula sp. 1 TL-2023]
MSSDIEDMDIDGGGQPTTLVHQNTEAELDEKYPNRPHNRHPTLPFHTLFQQLFNPLNDNKKRPIGPAASRRRRGPHSGNSQNPHEVRRHIIESYISRWRKEVGDDIYPAFRLILPEKDRERAMYGLKEKVLGRMFVKILKINKNSEDGYNLLNWKLPGQSAARMAGDFAGRCYEVISKRPMRTTPGDLTIGEVNDMLDQLAAAPKEETQLPVLQRFYSRMNAEELMWLVRIILRQMKVGASEKTIFEIWHQDAESLFNVSSSLRRVCWELHDPAILLESEERGVNLMQCFQPQLAQFQLSSFQKMVERMQPTEDDPAFWIEEKMDGERMQLHMISDESVPGGKRFGFWSRKAKDYTYLYGNGFQDKNGALTRHLTNTFDEGVENIIIDGEMITWDPEGGQVPFGTLKTAALEHQRNPFAEGKRPLLRVFDVLYLNDRPLSRYTLRDRRRALEASIKPVPDRFEIHPYTVATSAAEIEPKLREVIEDAAEGLVMKNPRSAYRLNDRNDNWLKVKPEYMTEFGESLDCIVIGGYYGSGHRGGHHSSFLCGLRVADSHQNTASQRSHRAVNPMKCESFFKVGGGFTAQDYATIRHHTENKWRKWDPKRPPIEYIELGGGELQYERPDEWILPSDSVVVCVKAASVTKTETFKAGMTLRFPRFKRLRMDKSWETALSKEEFKDLKQTVDEERRTKEFKVDSNARKRLKTTNSRARKPLTVSGYEARPATKSSPPPASGIPIFSGLSFFVLTESLPQPPEKPLSKPNLESLISSHGGLIHQTHTTSPDTLCIADKNAVRAASLKKRGDVLLIRSQWIFDCIAQARADGARGLKPEVVPFEVGRHLFFVPGEREEEWADNVDGWGDSFARDAGVEELKEIFAKMDDGKGEDGGGKRVKTLSLPERHRHKIRALLAADEDAGEKVPPGWILEGTVLCIWPPPPTAAGEEEEEKGAMSLQHKLLSATAQFAGARIVDRLEEDEGVTHVVVVGDVATRDREGMKELRKRVAEDVGEGKRVPRIVSGEWVKVCIREGTRVDEEGYVV